MHCFHLQAHVFDNLYVKYCQNMNATVKNEMTPPVKEFFAVSWPMWYST